MLVIRKISSKRKWDKSPEISWLGEDDLQADVLTDLETSFNRLSIWLVENYTEIDRVINAMALARERPANFDYAVFNFDLLIEHGFTVESNPGDTPDGIANMFHRDLVNLSVTSIVTLAKIISQVEIKRIREKVIQERLRSYLHLEGIDRAKIHPVMRNKLENF